MRGSAARWGFVAAALMAPSPFLGQGSQPPNAVPAQDAVASAPNPEPRLSGASLFALDTNAKQIVELAVPIGERTRVLNLPGGDPVALLATPDGSRLLVLHEVDGRLTLRGFRPSAPTTLSIVDTRALSLQSTVALGWGWSDIGWTKEGFKWHQELGFEGTRLTRDGKSLMAICPGFDAKDPAESRPQELLVVDLEQGKVTQRIAVGSPASEVTIVAASSTGVTLFSRGKEGAKGVKTPAQLLFVETSTGVVETTLTLELDVQDWVLSPDQTRMYLLGARLGRPAERFVAVVLLGEQKMEATLPVSPGASWFVPDAAGRQVMLLGQTSPEQKPTATAGRLTVLRGAEIAADLAVVAGPRLIRRIPAHGEMLVVGDGSISVVDEAGWTVKATIPIVSLGPDSSGTREKPAHDLSEVLLSQDGTRAFVLYGGVTKLATVDLEAGKPLTTITTGRTSERIGQAIAGALVVAGNAYLRTQAARTWNDPSFLNPTMYTSVFPVAFDGLAPGSGLLRLRPDGKYLYAFNSETSDLTVVETQTGKVLDKIGFPVWLSFPIDLVPRTQLLVGLNGGRVSFFDMSTNKLRESVDVAGMTGIIKGAVLSPDGKYFGVAVYHKVAILEAATAKIAALIDGFKKVSQVSFAQPQP